MAFNRYTRAKIPQIAWLYYRDACCVAEISRRLHISQPTVSKVIDSGSASSWMEKDQEDREAAKDRPAGPLFTLVVQRAARGRRGTTKGRFLPA